MNNQFVIISPLHYNGRDYMPNSIIELDSAELIERLLTDNLIIQVEQNKMEQQQTQEKKVNLKTNRSKK